MTFNYEQHLAIDLWLLDAILTGKDSRSGRGDPDSIGMNLFDFVEGGREFYLSDGGYSRVCYGRRDGKLFLTSNSRQEVVDWWEKAATVRRRVEGMITTFLRNSGITH